MIPPEIMNIIANVVVGIISLLAYLAIFWVFPYAWRTDFDGKTDSDGNATGISDWIIGSVWMHSIVAAIAVIIASIVYLSDKQSYEIKYQEHKAKQEQLNK